MKLKDLKCHDDMYYVGHLVDTDSNGWVNEESAKFVLKQVLLANETDKAISEMEKSGDLDKALSLVKKELKEEVEKTLRVYF